jgi:dihydropyrimidinase
MYFQTALQPGGIDSHVHIAQSAAKSLGAKSADDWTSATRSAVGGGTTSVLAFAVQNRGCSMKAAVDDYHGAFSSFSVLVGRARTRLIFSASRNAVLATGNAVCDYGFHVIVTDPSEEQMNTELVQLMDEGITSIKIYSTYPALKLNDTQILDTFYAARQHGVTVSERSFQICTELESMQSY